MDESIYTCGTCGCCLEGSEGETRPLCGGDTGLEFQIEALNFEGPGLDGSQVCCAISRLGEFALDGISDRRDEAEEMQPMLGLAGDLIERDRALICTACDANRGQVVADTALLAKVLAAYRELADGLDALVHKNRINEDGLGNDFHWLRYALVRIRMLDTRMPG